MGFFNQREAGHCEVHAVEGAIQASQSFTGAFEGGGAEGCRGMQGGCEKAVAEGKKLRRKIEADVAAEATKVVDFVKKEV